MKMSPFKTDHNLILWKLEKKRELSQKSPRLATEPLFQPHFILEETRGVAIFAKAWCSDPLLGRDEVTRTNRGAEGIGGRVKFLLPCRIAFYFVSTFAIAQTPTKQPALRLSRTKNLHFAKATFPGFSATELGEKLECADKKTIIASTSDYDTQQKCVKSS
jgi:hypothetical protein